MKTIAKINPENEYTNAKKLIELASLDKLDSKNASSLDSSVDNLITATRVLIEREERRRGRKKTAPKEAKPKGRKKGETREDSKKLPSKRFPDLEIEEDIIYPDHLPQCPRCKKIMKESGLFIVSEKLEVIPKKYYIQRNKRPKYNCSQCYGTIVNAPRLPSIVPTSNYGDSLIIDVGLTKYCDLIPIERYVQIAFRNDMADLPAQSLIGLTHHLANFLSKVYKLIKNEVLSTFVLHSDETPHKMLEGDDTKNWHLWGFFSSRAGVFEAHNTRSGKVVFDFLKESKVKYIVSDGYAAYGKAVKDVKNKLSREVIEVQCNAHAYRYFKDASSTWKEESELFLKLYGEIYNLEEKRKNYQDELTIEEQLTLRQKMIPLFEQVKENCEKQKEDAMSESSFKNALNYFLNRYPELTLCTTNVDIPLDNNLIEREFRPPVVGRKTWIGTHSKRGAKTAATLFSIIQSCKLNNVNPRNYVPWVVNRIHKGENIFTPYEYSQLP